MSGTGNFGRVTEADVLASLGQAPKSKAPAEADEGLAMREEPDLPDGPKVTCLARPRLEFVFELCGGRRLGFFCG